MITKAKRKRIAIFIYRLGRFLNDPVINMNSMQTIEKITKVKEVAEWLKMYLSNYTLFQTTDRTDYDDILESAIYNHNVYDSFNRLSKEVLIAKIRQMFIDEFEYESANNLLPGEGSNGFIGMIGTGEITEYIVDNNIPCPYDNHNYTYTIGALDTTNPDKIIFKVEGDYQNHKKERLVTAKLLGTYISYTITPSPRDYNEKEWLRVILSNVLMDYTSFVPNIDLFIERINEMVAEIDRRINSVEADSVEISNLSEENSNFNPNDNIGGYSHRSVSIPIMGNLMGTELEFDGNKTEIFKFRRSFERLINLGWILERDASVTFEMKSPVMNLSEIQRVFNQNKMLFKTWANLTNPEKAGLHFHISADDSFSVDKRPASRTRLFMLRITQMFESTVLKDSDSRKTIFKRDYQSYCREYGETDNSGERYRWINFQNLERDVGKTIEIRLFSSSAANELDEAAERALLIAKFFKAALKDWRAKNRPEFMTWQQGFGNTKIFKALFSGEDRKRWIELFTNSIKNVKKV